MSEEGVDKKLKGQHIMTLLFSIAAGIVGVLAVGGGLEGLRQYFHDKQPDIIVSLPPNIPEEVKAPPKASVVEPIEELEELLTNDNSDIVIDLPDILEEPPPEFLDVAEVQVEGDPIGDVPNEGVEAPYAGLPGIVSKRCSREDRLLRIESLGGNPASEDAVESALQWLAETQNSDGSWGGGKDGEYPKIALTSLNVLAFLGRCETPVSVNADYRNSVRDALDFLISKSQVYDGDLVTNGPKLHMTAYVQAVMAYALCETYTFCDTIGYTGTEGLEDAVKYSILSILKGQNDNGGWVYEYGEHGNDPTNSDTSLGGWCMQALKAAKFTGIQWPGLDEAIKKNQKIMEEHQDSINGNFGYTLKNARTNPGLTMVGALVLQQHKGGRDRIEKALKFYENNAEPALNYSKGGNSANLYEHYYASQVMVNEGGEYWEKYRDLYLQATIDNQANEGSFKIPNKPVLTTKYFKDGKNGKYYSTALSVLMLEVFYRFLPTTQAEVASN